MVDGVGDECVNYLEERDLHILQGFKRCQMEGLGVAANAGQLLRALMSR